SAENKRQLFIPAGYAHGFCVTSEGAELEYKCTDFYVADDQHAVVWNDPSIGIEWPVRTPILSETDRQAKALTTDRSDLPVFEGAIV
ncbi:MAG TPA: dTDP-4-dehydrorhamnose 3,5-epimerase, partial [Gemmatimonadales bacterium]|nr:dTDP-4-dehydrorhamnose 3,5-epimerase [Gemmatimonadales bacterium]